jgi:hypothetical protein
MMPATKKNGCGAIVVFCRVFDTLLFFLVRRLIIFHRLDSCCCALLCGFYILALHFAGIILAICGSMVFYCCFCYIFLTWGGWMGGNVSICSFEGQNKTF